MMSSPAPFRSWDTHDFILLSFTESLFVFPLLYRNPLYRIAMFLATQPKKYFIELKVPDTRLS